MKSVVAENHRHCTRDGSLLESSEQPQYSQVNGAMIECDSTAEKADHCRYDARHGSAVIARAKQVNPGSPDNRMARAHGATRSAKGRTLRFTMTLIHRKLQISDQKQCVLHSKPFASFNSI